MPTKPPRGPRGATRKGPKARDKRNEGHSLGRLWKPRPKGELQSRTMRLPTSLMERLDKRAEDLGWSANDLVIEALDYALSVDELPADADVPAPPGSRKP